MWISVDCSDDKIIPANLLVVVLFYFVGQDPKLYDNPLKWDPEHFNEKAIKQRPRNSQLLFGYGRRNCIGMFSIPACILLKDFKDLLLKLIILLNVGSKYAMMAIKIQMVYILSHYHLSSSVKELTKENLKGDVSIRSKIGYPIKLTTRSSMTK